MEIVDREPRSKKRIIRLHRDEIFHDIDVISYKLAESVAPDAASNDHLSTDSTERLDGELLNRLLGHRVALLRRALDFCIKREDVYEVDNRPKMDEDIVFDLRLNTSFNDNDLEIAMTLMHNYLTRGTLCDYYEKTGSGYAETLAKELVPIHDKIVDIFRVRDFVRHPSILYLPSFRNR